MEKEQLLNAYKSKILGIRNYKSDKEEFFVADLTEPKMLAEFMVETFLGESDITPAGKSFLDSYYGIDRLTEVLMQEEKFRTSYGSTMTIEEIKQRLSGLEPMEIRTFIEESRGTIEKGASLREDLLPPKDF